MAVPFDVGKLKITGTPAPVIQGIAERLSSGFSVSRSGSLVYLPQASTSWSRTLAWVDRKGSSQPVPIPPREYSQPRLSPDGRLLALSIYRDDIWIYDISKVTFSRLIFGGNSGFPVWFPDGNRLTFASIRAGPWAIFWKPVDGGGPDELLMRS